MKKKLSFMLFVGILAIFCIGAVATYANIQDQEFLQAGETAASTEEGNVYVTVNSKPIYQGEIDRAMQTEQLLYEASVELIEAGGYLTEE